MAHIASHFIFSGQDPFIPASAPILASVDKKANIAGWLRNRNCHACSLPSGKKK